MSNKPGTTLPSEPVAESGREESAKRPPRPRAASPAHGASPEPGEADAAGAMGDADVRQKGPNGSGEKAPEAVHTPAPISLEGAPVPSPPSAQTFAPPAILGIRGEVTQPLDAAFMHRVEKIAQPSDALPEPPTQSGAGEALFGDEDGTEDVPPFLDEVAGDPLGEKTVDIEIPAGVLSPSTSVDKSALSTDESATVEGAPLLDEGTEVSIAPPEPGTSLTGERGEKIRLEEPLGEQRGSVFFRARIEGEEQPFTAVWTPEPPDEPPWERLPDPRVVRPRARATLEQAAVRVFERLRGHTVVDYLADGERLLPAMATLELGIELAEILEGLHGAGLYIYDLDPSQIVIERGGRVRLYAIGGFYRPGQLPQGPAGVFVAPEVRRRMTYLVGAHSDVFAVALMVYALLARRSPVDTDLDPSLLPNPRVFRPECPLGIWPYLMPCLQATPGRRVGHARGLRQQLEKARGRLLAEARAADDPQPIVLEAWAELHIGLGKARRGAEQQDRAFSVTDDEGNVGLYIIADGVSRSRYGDGAFAAEQVEAAAMQRWRALEKAGPAALALTHAQRADILRQIARSAGKRIAREVNARYAPVANEPNQVMSATLAAAFIVGGEATVANLGDSRVYLIRDGTIEQVTIDHDRTTDALRMGLSFREAADVRMGQALTRVVGRVVIDEDGSCRPDPFEPEIFRVRLLPGDRLLLCSDGVADFAAGAGAPQAEAEKKMLETLLEYEDPARAAYELVVLANRAGGYDNISCVVIAAHPG